MRRRRQKNTLLPKMIGLAVVINAILLPLLAHFGAFKSIGGGQRLTPVELVKLPPVEKRPAPPKKVAKKQTVRPRPSGHKAAARSAPARRAPSGPPPVKVVAAGPAPGAANGSGDSGIAPSDSGPAAPPVAPVTPPPPPVTLPIPPPTPAPTPVPKPAAPATPSEPVATDAVILSQPQPVLPDDLNYDDIHGSFRVLFTIHADGSTDAKMISSTGNSRLDELALAAAHRWQFRPATLNGQPVQSYRRLEIQFYPI